jgi:valyl-tRNA synthetase
MGELPFKNVYFTGIIRDKQGRKMSKSLGNSPDPLDLISKFGADALRFGVMRSAPLGQDVLFDEKNVELGRNFCTKLWNAARFRQMQGGAPEGEIQAALLSTDDKWILLRLDTAIHEVSSALDDYRFSDAAQTLYRFFWSEYCDWYVEASKASLNGEDPASRDNTLAVMDFVLAHTLRLFHPFMPFITEELWHGLGFNADLPETQGGRSLMQARWPLALGQDFHAHYGLLPEDEKTAQTRFDVVLAGRGLRRDFNLPSNKRVPFILQSSVALSPHDAEVIRLLLNAESLSIAVSTWTPPRGTPSSLTPMGQLFLPLDGLVDVAAEKERLGKEIAKIEQELTKVRAKLSNETFVKGAPAAVVDEHRQREHDWQEKLREIKRISDALS